MKKILMFIGVVGVVGLGWFLVHSSSIDYVATVDNEVSRVEQELAKVEAEVSAGTLTTGEALKSHEKIATRLDIINDSVSASQGAELTEVQREMLLDGLGRLKSTLVRYQETLVAVDETVSGRNSSETTTLGYTLNETIEIVENYVVEVIEDYVPDTDEIEIEGETASSTVDREQIPEEDNKETSSSTATTTEEGEVEFDILTE